MQMILNFNQVGMNDVEKVGGKNASLGEMIQHLAKADVLVPGGFATTAESFFHFLQTNNLQTKINDLLAALDVDDVNALREAGSTIRHWVLDADFPEDFEQAITTHYQTLCDEAGVADLAVAVRSSATAEDLPEASFAGQQETYLNVSGIADVLVAVKKVFASLYNDRAISYRVHQGFAHADVALSAGIQRMVRSDCGASGVMFTVDTESGFSDVVFITASYGLGEMVVQGAVNPDEFYVHKPTLAKGKPAVIKRNVGSKKIKMIYSESGDEPVTQVAVESHEQQLFSLTDEEVMQLARYAVLIETHYERPMDIEWGRDGIDGKLYILQARPETVTSQQSAQVLERFILGEKSDVIVTGRSIGQRIGAGRAKVIASLDQMDEIAQGDVLVTDMTDPDWEPIMKRASAIVTNRGGRTCHAAIIAREMGIPAVVGCNDATALITHGTEVTVSCAEGETGKVYQGILPFDIHKAKLDAMPNAPIKIMMNVGNPDRAFDFQKLPNAGVGLARLEFVINRMIGFHPNALLHPDLVDEDVRAQIQTKTAAYGKPRDFYVKRLAEGMATLAASFYPKPVIIRFSDFKSNEYSNLIGGKSFEPHEENPMLGFRGASRYAAADFKDCFAMECEAVKIVREQMDLTNLEVMVPFVRTTMEAQRVIEVLKANGLERGKHGLRVIMMCEIPSNALLAEDFLQYFDGFSIGSNDLTQLTLGLDRDSGLVAEAFDERDPAVKQLLTLAIEACKRQGKYIGICGQGPSDHPDLAKWLAEKGIDSVSLNPDTVVETWLMLARG